MDKVPDWWERERKGSRRIRRRRWAGGGGWRKFNLMINLMLHHWYLEGVGDISVTY